MSSGSLQAVNILLDAGAEVSHSLKFMENADIPIEIKQRLNQYSQQNNMKPASTADGEKYGRLACLLYTSPSPRDRQKCRMPSSA